MTVFHLPDLGEGLREAEIVAWHVSPGDHVIADQPLVSVETDKAVVEVPSPLSGTVRRLLAKEGDVVATGGALVEIDTGAAEDRGAIVGELNQPEPAPAGGDAAPAESEAAPRAPAIRATPAARKLARERNVDLSMLAGSGPQGTIQTSDVLAAAEATQEGEALRGVRRSMARAMERSRQSVVPATVMDDADISAWPEGENPTLRLIRATVLACAEEPALNVWFDGERRIFHQHVHLAIAVDTKDGLFAPVVRSADRRSDLAQELARLETAVKERTVEPSDLRDATITLSNFGMIGGKHAVLVVTPPQVAILGAGRIFREVAAGDGRNKARAVLPLSLTFDHRAVTGGEAARFMAAVRRDLEKAV